MPFSSRKKQLQALESQLQSLKAELYSVDGHVTDRLSGLETIIEGHDATLDATAKALEALPAPETLASSAQIEELAQAHVEALAAQQVALDEQRALIAGHQSTMAEQRAVIDALRAKVDELANREAADSARVEARLSEISEQLLRQVEELSGEVDNASRLAQQASESSGVPGGVLDELKATQIKLANEQVRYDLALRAELAEIADRLRRQGR